ncbi:MAG: acetate--CoA ligase family protein, partial [Chromatiales bacterium]|nr:acetate--CoA ligase family protein [Chromatiales bacterium]
TKLVLAIKSARVPQSQDVEQTPPDGVLDGDEVYDAVFHRAGVLRVHSTDELFDALATLNHMRPLRGERLAIITNGVGPGVLATDRLVREGGRLADLSVGTTEALAKILPAFWTRRNPIDVSADAGPERYAQVVECVGRDPGVDALLVMHVPTLIAPPLEVAHAVIEAGRKINRNLLTSWIGMTSVRESRAAFDAAGVPNYFTPDKAVRAFLHMVQHRRHQEVLMETPPALTDKSVLDRVGAARVIDAVSKTDRSYLMPNEVRELLTRFDIPFADTHYAESVEGIQAGAERFGYPVALKVIHEANCHPFAYGRGTGQRWRGVALGIDGPQRLKGIAERMKRRAGERYTKGRTLGFAVQPMRSGMG